MRLRCFWAFHVDKKNKLQLKDVFLPKLIFLTKFDFFFRLGDSNFYFLGLWLKKFAP